MPVVLLCHFDGTNGSTSFTDSAPTPHTLTQTSTTVITTSPKFGTGAGNFTANATANISTGNASDFTLGAGQFTVETWAYFTSAPSGFQAMLSQWTSSGSNLAWWFGMGAGPLSFYYSTSGSDTPTVGGSFSPTLNTWYHLAADRDASNVLRVYVNGVVIASATVAATIHTSSLICLIGNDQTLARAFPGWLDEARITTGLAQYGGAFTPPTGPFGGAAAAAQAMAMVLA